MAGMRTAPVDELRSLQGSPDGFHFVRGKNFPDLDLHAAPPPLYL
jgi:hypothetical protein